MKTLNTLFLAAALVTGMLMPGSAAAQGAGTPGFTVHDRARGELSPGTEAPTREALMASIEASSPSRLATMLEYGERVECFECMPVLERRMLSDDDATVREMAAWWLRRRPFGFADIYHRTRLVLESDASEVRRTRAAAALGEFMVPNGVIYLTRALREDTSASVRVAAARSLIRLNATTALPILSEALRGGETSVQLAVLEGVLHVNFFRDVEGVIEALGSSDAAVRRQAALVLGALDGSDAAVPVLAAMVRGDESVMARQAAAWALGRIGGAEARSALAEVRASSPPARVRDAVEVALAMR